MGEDTIEVQIDTKNTENAKLGKGLEKYNKLIALTHFKGHGMTGFGGALKNVGMGLGSRGGKLDMHSGVSPLVDRETCIGCQVCVENCPVEAIMIENDKAVVSDECIVCGICIEVCKHNAVAFSMAEKI